MARFPTLALAALLAAPLGAQPGGPPPGGESLFDTRGVRPGSSDEVPGDEMLSFEERVQRRLPHRFERLKGPRKVDDSRLRQEFDRAVQVLIRLQQDEIQVDATLLRDLQRQRTQRRSPPGVRDLQDLEPAHIPSVEVLRTPLS